MNQARLRDGDPGFDAGLGARIAAMPCFREPTAHEVEGSYAIYREGNLAELCSWWREHAAANRAIVPFPSSFFYQRLGAFPRGMNGVSFLLTVRAGLAAGVRFREGLTPEVHHSIATDFPWLEDRHTHIPDGHTPRVDFPDVFRDFVDCGDLGDARARWQLAAVFNEVQQAAYTRWAAERFRLPELHRHAEREEALAVNYAAHWRPACTPELWRQTVWVLDALNAAIFDWVLGAVPLVLWRGVGGLIDPGEWRAFVAALDDPPVLVPPGDRPSWRFDL